MNKIKVVDDNLEKASINNNISIEYYEKECLFGINDIKLTINKSTDLEIEIELKEETKLNFNINVLEGVDLDLNILTKGKNGKIKYSYNLFRNSHINVFKFKNIKSIKEMISVKLKEENARIDYNFKTISNDKETYDYNVIHESNNTISNIKNNAVCIEDGTVIYQVSSFVPKSIIGCTVNQNNRIINLTNNKCEIMPNLYIDSSDVSASHSALIGRFSDEEMFYMQSRGIDYENAIKLLIIGFLTSDINDKKILKEINKNIQKYWR